MGVAFVQESRGGVLAYRHTDIPADGGRWDASPAPTVALFDSSGGELVASRTATLGPTTTLSSSAAAAQRTIPVTATTSINRGEQFVIGPNATGQSEWVTCEQVGGGNVVARDDLEYTYASADVFASHKMELTLTAADITTTYKDAYARWSFTVDSVQLYEQTIFHVSKYAPRLSVTPQDVLTYDATALHSLGDLQTLGILIAEVWDRHILVHLGQMFDPSALISGTALHLATIYKVLELIASGNKEEEERDQWRGQYSAAMEASIVATPVDLDQSGGVDENEKVRNPHTARLMRG